MILYSEILNYFPPIYNIGTSNPITETQNTYSSSSHRFFPLNKELINDETILYQLQIVRQELTKPLSEEELLLKLKTLINNWGPELGHNIGLNILNKKTLNFIASLINHIESNLIYRDNVIKYAESLGLEHNLKLKNGTHISVDQLGEMIDKTKLKLTAYDQNFDLNNLLNSLTISPKN